MEVVFCYSRERPDILKHLTTMHPTTIPKKIIKITNHITSHTTTSHGHPTAIPKTIIKITNHITSHTTTSHG